MSRKISRRKFRVVAGSLFFILFLQLHPLSSQDLSGSTYQEIRDVAEERYGPNADLLNGEKYYYPYRSAKGNPFFELGDDADAQVQIRGKLYENQKVRYDICNQHMVLDFLDRTGAEGSIVLRNTWLDFVIIDGNLFKIFRDDNGLERFGQVIFESRASCVYFWNKKYLPDLHEGENHYLFSDAARETVIVVGGQTTSYTGNRSFLKCFAGQKLPHIKEYLKENRIRVKKARDQEMRLLMAYINQLQVDEI